MLEQIIISVIIITTLIFFIWGRWRYDVVALLALFTVTFLGLLSIEEMFLGFVHPVVVLIIAMLLMSNALINSGAIDFIGRHLKFANYHYILQLFILLLFTVFLSAFVNSMGALAFVIPIGLRMARQTGVSFSIFLMPLAFASHFGGSMTLVGSASNIIVSGIRAQEIAPFGFFDFMPVAFPIAIISILFIVIVGWRLVPKREGVFSENSFLKNYVTELKILENSPAIGKTLKEFQDFSKEHFAIFAVVRGKKYIFEPSSSFVLKKEDVIVVEAEMSCLEVLISIAKLEIVYKKPFEDDKKHTDELEISEVVISGSSFLIGETAKDFDLHNNYQINFLALHRAGKRIKKRLKAIRLKEGDVLIIQGKKEKIDRFARAFGLLSLRKKDFHFEGKKESALLASFIFGLSILFSVIGVFPVHFVFIFGAMIMGMAGLVSFKKTYSSIDFSVIVLIAVMLQLGDIFYKTGAASSFAEILLLFEGISPEVALGIILLLSIWLSDILSNVTVAVLLAPVSFSIAQQLGVSVDPFLIAVAIGSGSSYLTPLGHQSNIFVMGMGGYKFGDYWKLGLPLELITFFGGMFLILRFWAF